MDAPSLASIPCPVCGLLVTCELVTRLDPTAPAGLVVVSTDLTPLLQHVETHEPPTITLVSPEG